MLAGIVLPALGGVLGAGQRVDHAVFQATSEPLLPDTVIVSTSQIISLCADDDGCRLRLIIDAWDGGFRDIQHRGRYFSTSSDGIEWWTSTETAPSEDGRLNDGSDELILFITGVGGGSASCIFEEELQPINAGVSNYVLSSDTLTGSFSMCTLTIAD